MNFLAQIRMLHEQVDLDAFVFQGPGSGDWVERMEDSQDRAAQVCIFEAARALAMMLDTYPIATIHPKWAAESDRLLLKLDMVLEDGTNEIVIFPSMPYSLTWTERADNSEVWQEAMLMLDDICQPSIVRCVPLLNRAFPHPMDSAQLIQASSEHAQALEVLWQDTLLQLDTPQAAGAPRVRRP